MNINILLVCSSDMFHREKWRLMFVTYIRIDSRSYINYELSIVFFTVKVNVDSDYAGTFFDCDEEMDCCYRIRGGSSTIQLTNGRPVS